MKISFANLFVLFSALSVALVATEDVQGVKGDNSEAKWLYWGGGIGYGGLGSYYGNWLSPYYNNAFGFGVYNYLPRRWYRRALQTRGDESNAKASVSSTVQCSNAQGVKQEFSTASCLKAATKISKEQITTATCGTCTIQLHNKEGPIQFNAIPPQSELNSAVNNMLKACSKSQDKLLSASELSRRSPAENGNGVDSKDTSSNKNALAIILLKGNGPECN
ncbi:hypothetical protein BY996DRAFT_6408421 [Phakopsora pachyrhizi]|uniref:Expressed protein n=1 Tax=Phakopsora pachyrhizi TaxID=170000 RepID=A0AAV0BN47_PHAPC|nr:hypothetical protein BY996DRAFT_6408421 [Phakopsora pachyrhizi]CAH7687803.1 expressed protein [Phakopsora pachyrhizi]